jgi:uncharacterized membrane protein YgaE (UPF0421/DUF939 family)
MSSRPDDSLSQETKDRISRVSGGIIGGIFSAIAAIPPDPPVWLLPVMIFVIVPLVLWRDPGHDR